MLAVKRFEAGNGSGDKEHMTIATENRVASRLLKDPITRGSRPNDSGGSDIARSWQAFDQFFRLLASVVVDDQQFCPREILVQVARLVR